MDEIKINLSEKEMPRQWYNLNADLPLTLPPLGPDGNPVTPDKLMAVFPMNLIEQEVSQERWINIPEGILKILVRTGKLEKYSLPDSELKKSIKAIDNLPKAEAKK